MGMIRIGRCKDCIHRDSDGDCLNEAKLHEREHDTHKLTDDQKKDHLIYDYYESGGFWVGPYFGCVHWKGA